MYIEMEAFCLVSKILTCKIILISSLFHFLFDVDYFYMFLLIFCLRHKWAENEVKDFTELASVLAELEFKIQSSCNHQWNQNRPFVNINNP